jgi:hypothetical protein
VPANADAVARASKRKGQKMLSAGIPLHRSQILDNAL